MLARAKKELARRKALKDDAIDRIGTTVELARLTGSNVYDKMSGRYPWMPFQEEVAGYLDHEVIDIGLPIKVVAISRCHLKTEIGCQAMVRRILKYPERRNCIIGAISDRAEANLANIRQICESRQMQDNFGAILPPNGDQRYTNEHITVNRAGSYREKTIETLGRNARIAGRHYNGIIWIDDIVSEQDNFNGSDVTKTVLRLLTHINEFVADPGAEIWMTFTRYHPADPYGVLINPDGEHYPSLVQPIVVRGCYDEAEDGTKKALYPFKYCMKDRNLPKDEQDPDEEEVADVEFRGESYKMVPRKSLVQMERRTEPSEFYAQMLNKPMSGAGIGFDPLWFDNVLPVTGEMFRDWVDDEKDEAGNHLGKGNLAPLTVHIVGDPSYRGGRQNDFSTLFVVAQTLNNRYIVLDGFRKRFGYLGDLEYVKQTLYYKDKYQAHLLGIEKHAKESIETVFKLVAAEEGRNISLAPLPNNSHVGKKDRIATLVPLAQEKRLWWCAGTDELRLAVRDEAATFPGCCDGQGGLHDDGLDGLANLTQIFHHRNPKRNPKDNKFCRWRKDLPRGVARFLR